MKQLKFALDFDETYTADPELWSQWISNAIYRGHSVTFVTFRFEHLEQPSANEDIREAAAEHGINIVFCNARQKSHCFTADIWIDDMPALIPSYDELKNMAAGCEAFKDTQA
jgi:MarR-like DNA-binding transcriptional regulator SgrR of sgrS sRNA